MCSRHKSHTSRLLCSIKWKSINMKMLYSKFEGRTNTLSRKMPSLWKKPKGRRRPLKSSPSNWIMQIKIRSSCSKNMKDFANKMNRRAKLTVEQGIQVALTLDQQASRIAWERMILRSSSILFRVNLRPYRNYFKGNSWWKYSSSVWATVAYFSTIYLKY
jgi:hypothetical protein